MRENTILPVSENKRPLYWNSTSGFNIDLFIIIYMSFCITLACRQPCWICFRVITDHPLG